MAMKIQFRRDTASSWTSNNPVLLEGELGLDTTDDRFKIGDGTTNWNTLAYSYGDWNTLINKPSTFTPSAGGSVGQVLTNVSNGVGTWQDAAGGVNLTSATTAPSSPTAGDQWFDTANGILYAYMTDGTQTQWLDISSANGQAAAAAAGGGAMELISTTNVAANALNVSITGLTGYSSYKLIINNLVLTGTNASQYILLQTMSGGSVSPAGSVYTSTTHYGANWTLHNGVASGHQMMYNPGTQGRVSVDISNLNQGAPTMFSSVGSNLPYGESRFATQVSSGIENSTGTRDGLYLYLSHYNFGAGTDISLYGIKDS